MLSKIQSIGEEIKGGESNGKVWSLRKVKCENGQEATCFNPKEGGEVWLRYDPKYKNFKAISLTEKDAVFLEQFHEIKKLIFGGEPEEQREKNELEEIKEDKEASKWDPEGSEPPPEYKQSPDEEIPW